MSSHDHASQYNFVVHPPSNAPPPSVYPACQPQVASWQVGIAFNSRLFDLPDVFVEIWYGMLCCVPCAPQSSLFLLRWNVQCTKKCFKWSLVGAWAPRVTCKGVQGLTPVPNKEGACTGRHSRYAKGESNVEISGFIFP